MIDEDVKHVIVVGGGTSGWITAGVLASKCVKEQGRDLKITLIESPTVGNIGVGEGTWPSLRTTLQGMGISETEFINKCDVSFKQGARFNRWADNSEDDFYYHPLSLPMNMGPLNTLNNWLRNNYETKEISYSSAVCHQEVVCELGLAPKDITVPEYQGLLNYAYHLDTNKFSVFMKEHCIEKLGINHIVNDVVGTTVGSDGEIDSLCLEDNTELSADFYIDCSGLSGLLIDKHFNVPFLDKSDILFCDRALAVQCPYADKSSDIASHTISTATGSGWIWDIGLQSRRGIGHVYSSRYMSDDEAEQGLREYLGQGAADIEFRKITFKPGHREKFWIKNCVAVGLSAGFVEPLEASSILLVEISAYWIAEKLPFRKSGFARCEKQFNEVFSYRWETIIEFLKLHYCISRRTDTRFWIDNTDSDSIPDILLEKLTMWREQCPSVLDFLNRADVFPLESYCYILYGMKFKTAANTVDDAHLVALDNKIRGQRHSLSALLNSLPKNRSLIDKIYEYGMQKI